MQDKEMRNEDVDLEENKGFAETLIQLIASEAKRNVAKLTSDNEEHAALERKLKDEFEEFCKAVRSYDSFKESPEK